MLSASLGIRNVLALFKLTETPLGQNNRALLLLLLLLAC